MENMDTWTKDNVSWHGTAGFGVFKHYGMAQEGHAWVVRQNPRIRAVFEKGVFKEECVVSLDGTCALFHADKSKLELHVDIVKNIPGAEMHPVQGSYTLWGSEVRGDRLSAGFVVVPRSHQLFDEMWAAREQLEGFKRPAKHFHVLEPDSPLQEEAAFVVQPANSLVLWRSELLHKNYGGDIPARELGRECRLVQFISWHPRSQRSAAALQKKIKAAKKGKCCDHWAALGQAKNLVAYPCWAPKAKLTKTVVPKLPAGFERLL